MNKSILKNWTIMEIIWLLFASLSTLSLGIYWGDSPLEIVSSVTGILSVILVAKKMSINYLFGLINVATYAYLSYKSGFLVEVALNVLYYVPMQFIGYYMWKRAKEEHESEELPTKKLSVKQIILLSCCSIASILIVGMISKAFGGSMPIVDAASSVLSVLAMYLMVKQYMEQWYLWIIINVISILMWRASLKSGVGDMATLLMWSVYLLNSIFGLISWKKSLKNR